MAARKQHAHDLKDLAGVLMDKSFLNKMIIILSQLEKHSWHGGVSPAYFDVLCQKICIHTTCIKDGQSSYHSIHANRSHITNKEGSVRLQRISNKTVVDGLSMK